MAMAVYIVLRIFRRARAHNARTYAHACTPWAPDAARAPSGVCLRDFPLRVRVHSDVSGLRERNFGKSRR